MLLIPQLLCFKPPRRPHWFTVPFPGYNANTLEEVVTRRFFCLLAEAVFVSWVSALRIEALYAALIAALGKVPFTAEELGALPWIDTADSGVYGYLLVPLEA